MVIYFLIVFAIYFVLVLLLITGWQLAIEKKDNESSSDLHTLSVIIPFRNEATHLPRLLKNLANQNYNTQNVEIIFVDDHSTDESATIISSFLIAHPYIKLMHLSQDEGKKKAISLGIAHAQNDIIVTTDADCSVSPNWLTSIHQSFVSEEIMMCVGAVKIESNNTFFSKLQAIEFASLIGSSAATLSYGVPTMCNGANLSFRREAFNAVNGYEGNFEIASGDDEFLMRKFSKKFPHGIRFIGDGNCIVATEPSLTLRDFLQQRVRWASKWKYNDSWQTKSLAFFILLFQLSYLTIPIITLAGWLPFKYFILLVATKIFLEFLFLYPTHIFLQIRWRWIHFVTLQFIYPIYVVCVGLIAQGKSFEWKGRKNGLK
jgi:poly-beta-1,6-N-acetyl-D-glucosamine synthase